MEYFNKICSSWEESLGTLRFLRVRWKGANYAYVLGQIRAYLEWQLFIFNKKRRIENIHKGILYKNSFNSERHVFVGKDVFMHF